jgi:tetratricopeptide (TPR) repeat protein
VPKPPEPKLKSAATKPAQSKAAPKPPEPKLKGDAPKLAQSKGVPEPKLKGAAAKPTQSKGVPEPLEPKMDWYPPKTAKSKGAPGSLESKLNEAIEMLIANKADEAATMFEAVAKEAAESGNFSMARAAKSYILNRQHKKVAPEAADPIQEIVFLLNAKQPGTALEKIEKILKAQSSNAYVHYLKALGLAGTQQIEMSAQCLKKAIDMDSGLLFLYKLEPDFKPCRKSSCFTEFEIA